MKNIKIAIALLFLVQILGAQTTPEKVIGFAPIINNVNFTTQEAKQIHSKIVSSFVDSPRYKVVNLEDWKEQNRNDVQQEFGLTHLLECELEGMDVWETIRYAYTDSTETMINAYVEVNAKAGVRVRLYNLSTGELERSVPVRVKASKRTESHRTRNINTARTVFKEQIKAITPSTISLCKQQFSSEWAKKFPFLYPEMYDIEVLSATDKKVKEVKVLGGQELNLSRGEYMNLVYDMDLEYDGKTETIQHPYKYSLFIQSALPGGYEAAVYRKKEMKRMMDEGRQFKAFYKKRPINKSNRRAIGILPIETDGSLSPQEIDILQSRIRDQVARKTGFKILDRSRYDVINKKTEEQKSAIFEDASLMAEQGKRLGADFVLIARVSQFDAFEITEEDVKKEKLAEKKADAASKIFNILTRNTSQKGAVNLEVEPRPEFKSKLTLNVKIVSTETGQILYNEKWGDSYRAVSKFMNKFAKDKDKEVLSFYRTLALANTQDLLKGDIQFNANSNGIKPKFESRIVKIEKTTKKGKAEMVWVKSTRSLNTRQSINVYRAAFEEVGGEKFRLDKKIGSLYRTKTSDGYFYYTEVRKGGRMIQEHFDKGEKLYVKIE